MKTSKLILAIAGLVALSLVGFALYLQQYKEMMPCPLCVIQRYVFVGIALVCFISVALPERWTRLGAGIGALAAIGGAGVAGWHNWVKAHPTVSCGIDPMETALNRIPTAELLPWVFRAEGLCATEYPPTFGLSVPQWALIWFVILAIALIRAASRRTR